MAKIILKDGTNGARRKMIETLKNELTHVFLATTSSISLGQTITPLAISNASSDESNRVIALRHTNDQTVFKTYNDLSASNTRITNFFLKNGRAVNKFVYVKESGLNYIVKAISTFTTITPTVDSAYFVNEFKIELLDQS